MASDIVPEESPKLGKQFLSFIALYTALTTLSQYTILLPLEATILVLSKDIYVAIAGIAATLAGFVIAGIAVLATILPKYEFKNSLVKPYYSQIYKSFHHAALFLIASIILALAGVLLPKSGVVGTVIFAEIIFIFYASFIFLYSSISIIRSLIAVDVSGVLNPQPEEEIQSTEEATESNGDLY